MTDAPDASRTVEQRPDGRHVYRRAARLVLVDETDEQVLLVRGFDPANPRTGYWFTIGGGVLPGEDPRVAAAREAFEEAGIVVEPSAMVGPVQPEQVEFPFEGTIIHQDQEYYLARVDWARPDTAGMDDLERRSTSHVQWVRLDQLAGLAETLYPSTLADLVARLRDAQPPRPRV